MVVNFELKRMLEEMIQSFPETCVAEVWSYDWVDYTSYDCLNISTRHHN